MNVKIKDGGDMLKAALLFNSLFPPSSNFILWELSQRKSWDLGAWENELSGKAVKFKPGVYTVISFFNWTLCFSTNKTNNNPLTAFYLGDDKTYPPLIIKRSPSQPL